MLQIYFNNVIKFVTDFLFRKLATENSIAANIFSSLFNVSKKMKKKTFDCHTPPLIL